jgi:hypothetical protein
MRKRPGESAQKAGRRWERFWATIFGTEPQPGSGNQWHAKMDVADGSITWSLKWTTHQSASISKALIREADEACYKNGDNSIPGIAIALDEGSETVVVLRAADFMRLLWAENATYIVPSKADQKRAISRVPTLLREDLADG